MDGKVALVCGASQGIGEATARVFDHLGARVILVSRSEDKLNSLKNSLEGRGGEPVVVAADLMDRAVARKKINKAIEKTGPVSILVCNSGGPAAGPLSEASEENFLKGFAGHVLANNMLVQLALPGMREKGYGRVINIISTSVKVPIPNLGVSNTIRGAVASWAKTLANELGGDGITVNNILPGFTDTPRLAALKEAAGKRLGKTVPEVEKMWLGQVPVGRFGDPKETAQAVAFLASPAAAYINGVNLPVDGGRLGCL